MFCLLGQQTKSPSTCLFQQHAVKLCLMKVPEGGTTCREQHRQAVRDSEAQRSGYGGLALSRCSESQCTHTARPPSALSRNASALSPVLSDLYRQPDNHFCASRASPRSSSSRSPLSSTARIWRPESCRTTRR